MGKIRFYNWNRHELRTGLGSSATLPRRNSGLEASMAEARMGVPESKFGFG